MSCSLSVGRWPSEPTSFTVIADGLLDLTHCSSLTELELSSCSLPLLTGTLATIQSIRMRSIYLLLNGSAVKSEWDALGAVLDQEQFLQLETIVFRDPR